MREETRVSWTEVAGFATGALCVWLVVREHVANFPVGIANNVFFIVLFGRAGLYADAGLQVVYIGLALYGWWWWLHGGPGRTVLRVTRTPAVEAVAVAAATVAGTGALTLFLDGATDSTVPFWDAVTTVLSLAATYLLTRKRLENWLVWIVADVIYVGLYAYKDLRLTAVLYAGFLALCVAGYLRWRAVPSARAAEALA
ncbi:MAG TPA: nicotinamide riboside transporter PnuC [Frankiaceae bacterium]|nr:nicotinamide riboside transporter PnuC [Frankiaceae bacterium]